MTSHDSLRVLILGYLCPYELLYREVSDFSKESSDKELFKVKLKKVGISSHCRLKHKTIEESLSKKELESLRNLSRNPDIIFQRSHKGNHISYKGLS